MPEALASTDSQNLPTVRKDGAGSPARLLMMKKTTSDARRATANAAPNERTVLTRGYLIAARSGRLNQL
jgi:hypothetical protein